MSEVNRILDYLAADPGLASRMLRLAEPPTYGRVIDCPDVALTYLRPLLDGLSEEALACLALDQKSRVIASTILTRGSCRYTLVDPRQVFAWALRQGEHGAAGIVLGHNHPSGDPTPSAQDREVTRRLAAGGRTLDVPLRDHIIVTDAGGWVSLAAEGLCGS